MKILEYPAGISPISGVVVWVIISAVIISISNGEPFGMSEDMPLNLYRYEPQRIK